MEKKLEHSGMGVLYAKKEHISSQDEKVRRSFLIIPYGSKELSKNQIIRANAAYARKEAERGFSNEEKMSRFKVVHCKLFTRNPVSRLNIAVL